MKKRPWAVISHAHFKNIVRTLSASHGHYIPMIQDSGNTEMFKEYYSVILICLSYVNKYLVLIGLKWQDTDETLMH